MRQRTTSNKLTHRSSAYAARHRADSIHWLFRSNIPRKRGQSFGTSYGLVNNTVLLERTHEVFRLKYPQTQFFWNGRDYWCSHQCIFFLFHIHRHADNVGTAGRSCTLSYRVQAITRRCPAGNQGKQRTFSTSDQTHFLAVAWLFAKTCRDGGH